MRSTENGVIRLRLGSDFGFRGFSTQGIRIRGPFGPKPSEKKKLIIYKTQPTTYNLKPLHTLSYIGRGDYPLFLGREGGGGGEEKR